MHKNRMQRKVIIFRVFEQIFPLSVSLKTLFGQRICDEFDRQSTRGRPDVSDVNAVDSTAPLVYDAITFLYAWVHNYTDHNIIMYECSPVQKLYGVLKVNLSAETVQWASKPNLNDPCLFWLGNRRPFLIRNLRVSGFGLSDDGYRWYGQFSVFKFFCSSAVILFNSSTDITDGANDLIFRSFHYIL